MTEILLIVLNLAFMLLIGWLSTYILNSINDQNEPGGNAARPQSFIEIRRIGLGKTLLQIPFVVYLVAIIQELLGGAIFLTEIERSILESFIRAFLLAEGRIQPNFITVNTVVTFFGFSIFLMVTYYATSLINYNLTGAVSYFTRIKPVLFLGCWFLYFLCLPHRTMFEYPILTKLFSLNRYFENLKKYSVNGDVTVLINQYSGYGICIIIAIIFINSFLKKNNYGK